MRVESIACVTQYALYLDIGDSPEIRSAATLPVEYARLFCNTISFTEDKAYALWVAESANAAQYTRASTRPCSVTLKSTYVLLAETTMDVMLGAGMTR